MEEKRKALRVNVWIKCNYIHKIIKEEKRGEAVILNLSSKGCMMLTKEFLRPGKKLKIDIRAPLERLGLEAEVVDAKPEWYVTDEGKEMYFATRLKFVNTSLEQTKLIIKYVYKCRADLHQARFKKMGL